MARTDDVVEAIKEMIHSGALSPGDRLPVEPELAAQLDLSRSCLREGVRALIAMGVLEARQGAGTYVTSLDLKVLFAPMEFVAELQHHDALEFLHVRRALEGEAAAAAARLITEAELDAAEATITQAAHLAALPGPLDHEGLLTCDRTFHAIIAQASRNNALDALLKVVTGRTWRLRLWRSQVDKTSVMAALSEHQAILNALRQGDPERARLEMQVHLLAVEDFVRAQRAATTGTPAEDGHDGG